MTRRGHGVLRVSHGRNLPARLCARLLLLPDAGDAVDTRLVVTPNGRGEHWHRTFGTRALDTRQCPVGEDGFTERIGALELQFRREASDGGTLFRQTGAALVMGPVRARLPRWCAPAVWAREDPAGDRRIHIDVRVSLPAVGPILTYVGTIDLVDPANEQRRLTTRANAVSEPPERSEPAKRRASDGVGESEGQSPSDKK